MMRWTILVVLGVLAIVAGVGLGPADISLRHVIEAVGGEGDATTVAIVRQLRVPRALLAFLVGGCLAITGASLQALVRNPLADPYLLGLSGGAGLGAVLVITLQVGGAWAIPAAAFVGAIVAITLVYRLALVSGGGVDPRVLLLAGVVVSALGGALLAAVFSLSPAAELQSAMLWLLGGFGAASWRMLGIFAVYATLPVVYLYYVARPLDLLSLGQEPAQFLGADVVVLRRRLYVAASLLTAACVAVSGVIGFVGLVVPHAIRMVWGHAHRTLLPAAFLLGGTLLTGADAVARTLFAPRELPVGVVTSLIGVPVFAMLLRRWAK
ncbi:MAG: iron ABC transporter permease [Gemmatimonadetes bacterium]|nr:iron ABC transporter permease [Gemmatimonadota bacterium]